MEYGKISVSRIDDLKLNILCGHFVKCDSTWSAKNVISPYSRIYYVTGGTGYLTYDDKKIILMPQHLYFIPAKLKFDYKCDSNLEKYFFHINLFSNDYIDVFSTCKNIISFKSNRKTDWDTVFKQNNKITNMLLKSYLYNDLYQIALKTNIDRILQKTHSELTKNAISYINSHLSIKLKVKEVAKNLYVAPSTLSKHFREEMGFSIGNYIDMRIQFEIEQLLSESNLPIETISEQFGFCDRFYFTRKFKEVMNITPAKYRSSAQKTRHKM